jgi:hypothetical protein
MFIVLQYTVMYIANKGNYWRQKRRDIYDDMSGQQVKMLMSKFEILSNGKL